MAGQSPDGGPTDDHGMITIIGLGPGSLDRVPGSVRSQLLEPDTTVIVRTMSHPGAAELAGLRDVVSCDDLYEMSEHFGDVYDRIRDRVLKAAVEGPVIYAVPGSPLIGEFAVRQIMAGASEVEVIPAESFVDAVLAEVGYDPLDRGLQILNGHDLPRPLVLDKPTIIGHLDRPEILADVLDAVGRVTPIGARATILSGLGSFDVVVKTDAIDELSPELAGPRTSLFVDSAPGGLIGAVGVMRRLRAECPWDREQTHRSLVKNLIDETYELIDVIGRLPEDEIDWVAYSAIEDELGDVLLQVLFHAAIADEVGAFDIDGVGSVLTEKLIRRHPHVFGETSVGTADEVKRNWDRIKEMENGGPPGSVLDGVPESLPGMQRASKIQNRAAKVGFDWDSADQILPKIAEELEEMRGALEGRGDVEHELGDLLFSVVNLSRHLGVDPEVSLRRATDRFEQRFRRMESDGPLEQLSLDQLNYLWETAKRDHGPPGQSSSPAG